ncbi:hypothetical protein GKQ38_03070 [Candidatus Nanohaloarchaea archaeon]|nr:hypothetical protein GKQ38_03070 [Candidatus Nanohaloarchaea archaeon]
MPLDAFKDDDVYLLASSFILGYGILLVLMEGYLLDLSDVNIIIQSTALGLFLTALIGFPAKFIIEDIHHKSKAEKKKSKFNDLFEILRLFGGALLVVLGIIF